MSKHAIKEQQVDFKQKVGFYVSPLFLFYLFVFFIFSMQVQMNNHDEMDPKLEINNNHLCPKMQTRRMKYLSVTLTVKYFSVWYKSASFVVERYLCRICVCIEAHSLKKSHIPQKSRLHPLKLSEL